MNEAFLSTGGNMGDRKRFLLEAKKAIEKQCGLVLDQSSIYETAAWGKEDQEAFLNQVLKIETHLTAEQLLQTILKIEEALGRKRDLKYGPRYIDIDILFFGDEVVNLPGLHIPHPQIQDRRFVLEPLNEIAGNKIHPVLQKNISQILDECTDRLAVNKIIDDLR